MDLVHRNKTIAAQQISCLVSPLLGQATTQHAVFGHPARSKNGRGYCCRRGAVSGAQVKGNHANSKSDRADRTGACRPIALSSRTGPVSPDMATGSARLCTRAHSGLDISLGIRAR